MKYSPLPLLSALLAACDGGEAGDDDTGAACEAVPVKVYACVVPAGASAESSSLEAIRQVDAAGLVVTAAGTGAPPEGCRDFHAWRSGYVPLNDSTTRWVTLAAEAGGPDAWTVSWTDGSPAEAALPALGAALDLSWRQADKSPFAGEYGEHRLLLTEAGGGALWAWAEQAGGSESLTPPEGLSFSRGDTVECQTEEICGTKRWYDLVVSLPSGASAELAGGSAQTLEGMVVTHGSLYQIAELECSETAGGSIRVAATRP